MNKTELDDYITGGNLRARNTPEPILDETPKQVLFRMPAWERQNFDDLCHDLGVSQQAALTEACRDWIKTKRKMLDHAFLTRMARGAK